MLKKIIMPPGGQNTDQLLIAKWRKTVGDSVKRGDILLEVETDKAVLEVESYADGILLKRIGDEGDYATVGDIIAYIGKPDELVEEDTALKSNKTDSQSPDDDYKSIQLADRADLIEFQEISNDSSSLENIRQTSQKMSPAAKKLIRDAELDISDVIKEIKTTIIHKSDIERLISDSMKNREDQSVALPAELKNADLFKMIPLTSMRRTIASRMAQSTTTIPSFTAEVEVDMSASMVLRQDLNRSIQGTKISYNDIIAKCVAVACREMPLINASYSDEGIKAFKSVNIGLAVSLEQGLVVPVVKDVGSKQLAEIARENSANIADARAGKFDPKLLENGTFTISNLGTFPITRFTAIINPPQVCILAVGTIRKVPVIISNELQEKSVVSITASFDHRVIDGAYGAQFLTRLKELLENPVLLLL
jgi:pyruvate dehydrogenase E2 component (dihydrolipoamide acetyltransferase)